MASFKKGQQVYTRTYTGAVIYNNRYSIRSCGKKQAVLEPMSLDNHDNTWNVLPSRGQTFYLDGQDRIDYYIEHGMDTTSLKTDWNQHFVLAGVDGWDAEEN